MELDINLDDVRGPAGDRAVDRLIMLVTATGEDIFNPTLAQVITEVHDEPREQALLMAAASVALRATMRARPDGEPLTPEQLRGALRRSAFGPGGDG